MVGVVSGCPYEFREIIRLEFITQSDNQSRYASLTEQEKRVLYYYCRLNKQNQRDILLFMRIKLHNEQ